MYKIFKGERESSKNYFKIFFFKKDIIVDLSMKKSCINMDQQQNR